MSKYSKKLSETRIVVDKMHMRGHVDPWCKQYCDSRNIKDLDKVGFDIHEVIAHASDSAMRS